MKTHYDVVIIGAGAAGLMAAIHAGRRGRTVCVVDHAKKLGTKIRISGGGRCNFTNLYVTPANYLSENPHFCKSALKQYTQYDFIDWVETAGIQFHEKKLGQLFCDRSAQDIVDLLLAAARDAGAALSFPTVVEDVGACANDERPDARYRLRTSRGELTCQSIIVATGGLSVPKAGASPFGYRLAEQFGLSIVETRAGLVPLTFQGALLDRCRALSGLSVDATVGYGDTRFAEGLLFTHRGLSGPSILQISSYWREQNPVTVNLAPQVDVNALLIDRKKHTPKQEVTTVLAELLPRRLALDICQTMDVQGRLADASNQSLDALADVVNAWAVRPGGTEGYRTAEVTLGGVDTNDLSSKTMEARTQPGLFFIGEVVDVTGHLGGFNFQWAWSSGYVAGQNA
ncbi:MAG: NAD(P)/FAD-dependent oxidoreductase [Myxococcota bacterium]|nr:NAD(P)/FAD-dependent oxidoreductase [Myxococcota bacterium]